MKEINGLQDSNAPFRTKPGQLSGTHSSTIGQLESGSDDAPNASNERDLQLEERPIASIALRRGNPRTHSERQIRQIATSIKTFGFTNPVLIDSSNTVIAGHGRVHAAKQLGLDTVPTIQLEHLTPEQVRAYVIADNKLAECAGWDRDLLAIAMAKTTTAYLNLLSPDPNVHWEPVAGLEGIAEAITIAIDTETGDYTRLTRFLPGSDTFTSGAKVHDYPEEVLVLEGRLYDAAVDRWLTAGDYASRPPGEVHGPFRTDEGCVVFEVSYPSEAS